MSSWMLIALASGLCSNTSNYLHRFLLKDDPDPALYTWFLEVMRLAVAVVFLWFDFHLVISLKSTLLLAAVGLVEAVSIYVYMKQHAFTKLSISTIISRTRLVWTAMFAFLFLNERLSSGNYVGILILFVGLSVGTAPHKIALDKGMKLSYMSAVLISVSNTIFKSASSFASVPVIVAAMAVPTVVGYPIVLNNSTQRCRTFLQTRLLSKILAALANVGALFLLLWALRTGPVGAVNAIYQGTMVFAILAGVFLLDEREEAGRKLLGTAVALVGIWLVVQ